MRGRVLFYAGALITVLGGGLIAVARAAAPSSTREAVLFARSPQDTSFGARILRLSEDGAYFDTDNLISNEHSYLHVASALRERAGDGAYLGVGPDQNFAYIALLRPDIAYIIDIRHDNLLEHLLFKALFAGADSRLAYLADLTGRRLPDDIDAWTEQALPDIVAYLDTAATLGSFDSLHAAVRARIRTYGYPLGDDDVATIERFHRAFLEQGLSLRFTSHGRAPMPYYPTLRDLLLATDRSGTRAGAFIDDAGFRFLKRMQHEDRIIPVVGDFAGTHALRAIAAELRRDNHAVRAFYTSNVEYYLFRDRSFDRFADNLAALPWHEDGVIIRSVFRSTSPRLADHRLPGFGSAQLAQRAATFLERTRTGGYDGYASLVDDEPLPPR